MDGEDCKNGSCILLNFEIQFANKAVIFPFVEGSKINRYKMVP